MKHLVLILPFLTLPVLADGTETETCQTLQSTIDAMPSKQELGNFLQKEVAQTMNLDALFSCSLHSNPSLPVQLEAEGYLHGDGWVPERSRLVRRVWGGKMFQKVADKTWLLNILYPTKSLTFAAEVYAGKSVKDHQPAIILDYRYDSTVKAVSQLFIRRIRDEIREITYQGQGSGIYIGKAFIFRGKKKDLQQAEWEDRNNFTRFSVNFVLDFNQESDDTPAWIFEEMANFEDKID